MHEPGHSSRGSGGEVVVGGCVVVGGGLLVVGRVFCTLVLSQHTEPLLQLEVRWMRTEEEKKLQLNCVTRQLQGKVKIIPAGFSQNAAIMFNKQKPGHRGNGG